MVQLRDRKWFVNTLGVAGLGLGLLASAAGAPTAMAQEHSSPGSDRPLFQDEEGTLDLSDEEMQRLLIQLLWEKVGDDDRVLAFQGDEGGKEVVRLHGEERGGDNSLRVAAYHEFTQALADELGIDDPDEVDAAIRRAMMAVVDANDGLNQDTKEWQKALIASAEAPIGPAYRGHGG